MSTSTEFTLAAIQAAPVFYDRDASTEKACRLIEDAASLGATIAAFGEVWLPGYPGYVGNIRHPRANERIVAYLANAVEVPSLTTDKLCEAARRAGIDVVIGIVEREARTSGTVYCTLLFISREGTILGKHRKLKPTLGERMAWGEGDGSGLRVYERPYARISGLNCWEHKMVLPAYALMEQGTQIHIAAWPGGNPRAMQDVLSRAFAAQGACYVICAAGLDRPEDHDEPYRELSGNWTGQSCIIDPWGNLLAGPIEGESIITAKGSLEDIYLAKSWCDVGGHYSRPDVFQLRVNRQTHQRVVRMDSANQPWSTAPIDHAVAVESNGSATERQVPSPISE